MAQLIVVAKNQHVLENVELTTIARTLMFFCGVLWCQGMLRICKEDHTILKFYIIILQFSLLTFQKSNPCKIWVCAEIHYRIQLGTTIWTWSMYQSCRLQILDYICTIISMIIITIIFVYNLKLNIQNSFYIWLETRH